MKDIYYYNNEKYVKLSEARDVENNRDVIIFQKRGLLYTPTKVCSKQFFLDNFTRKDEYK